MLTIKYFECLLRTLKGPLSDGCNVWDLAKSHTKMCACLQKFRHIYRPLNLCRRLIGQVRHSHSKPIDERYHVQNFLWGVQEKLSWVSECDATHYLSR